MDPFDTFLEAFHDILAEIPTNQKNAEHLIAEANEIISSLKMLTGKRPEKLRLIQDCQTKLASAKQDHLLFRERRRRIPATSIERLETARRQREKIKASRKKNAEIQEQQSKASRFLKRMMQWWRG